VKRLDVVVGLQFGSEAKGHVTQRLIEQFVQDWDVELGSGAYPQYTRQPRILNIRVAGPNAGHTAHDTDGKPVAFRQVPVGALIPGVHTAIAPGSEVDPSVLLDELQVAKEHGWTPHTTPLYIDPSATLLTDVHKMVEVGMYESIGSTGKGIGAARADRIMRKALQVEDDGRVIEQLYEAGGDFIDVPNLARSGHWDYIVVEGTQGFGLGLHAGFYPYCTSSDCRAIDFLAMAGINPWQGYTEFNVWGAARVFPIRVAGNSGPLRTETTWDALGLPPEYTTVTKKMRRVGKWDRVLVSSACRANGGPGTVQVAITMLDQLFPELAGAVKGHQILEHDGALAWINQREQETSCRVSLVTTGPNTGVFL
jgi:adenylosuccinate synthase